MSLITSHFDIILVGILFLGYMLLWAIKKKELYQATGVDADVIFRVARPIQQYFGVLEHVMKLFLVVTLVCNFILPRHLFFVAQFFGEGAISIKLIGFVFGLIGLLICRIAQITLGNSWRVGIDENAKPGLVQNGVYRFIRNPTYTGMYLVCVGAFILLPSLLVSYWILAFFIMLEFQVRCEEEYLQNKYGDDFIKYSKKTKRYIPWVY